jgi:hypothetical protein
MPAGVPASESIQPKNFEARASLAPQAPDNRRWRVASLGGAEFATEGGDGQSDAASFDQRFADRFPARRQIALTDPPANLSLPRPPDPGRPVAARRAVGQSAPGVIPLPPLPPAGVAKKQVRIADASQDFIPPPDADAHTAIYDIVAHRVYLPNGQQLEAHSGLGSYLDDPRYVSEKDRGPTPPNVYELALREEPFHGVRAVRLNPVGGGKMFGREGMLAHTYMLGPSGESNGCVSVNDYPTFLNAVLSGEINRLVVVEHLANAPGPKTAWGWVPAPIRALLGRT